jgi:transcriptional regulator
VLSRDAEVLHALLKRVTARYDTPLGGNWQFDDMAESMTAPQLEAIISVEIDRLEGKLKLNQNKSRADRDGVLDKLEGIPVRWPERPQR